MSLHVYMIHDTLQSPVYLFRLPLSSSGVDILYIQINKNKVVLCIEKWYWPYMHNIIYIYFSHQLIELLFKTLETSSGYFVMFAL